MPSAEKPPDVAGLLPLLRHELGLSHLTFAESPQPLGGGFSNDIFRFRLDGGPPDVSDVLVVRISHDDDDAAREALIQKYVSSHGIPAPSVVMWGSSASILSRPFSISPLMNGSTFEHLFRPRSAIGALRRLPAQLAETMSNVHAVAPEELAAQLALCGWTDARLASLGVLEEVESYAAELNRPGLTRGIGWLRTHLPRFGSTVVCHGDLHPLNLLFDGDRVVATLDWELARLADPAFDVARTALLLRMAPYPMGMVARGVVSPIAARLADSFIKAYSAFRPLDEVSLQWHDALHCLRTLTMASYGGECPENSRLRRLADVWLPVAPRLRKRFSAITSVSL